MKIDQRSKSARVRAAYTMAQERGRPVTRAACRAAVAWRIDIRNAFISDVEYQMARGLPEELAIRHSYVWGWAFA